MIEILKDWAEWLVGIPAIILTVWIYWKQTRTKKLTAKINSRTILNIYHEEIKKEVKIYYKDTLVETVFLTSIYFNNNGNAPIKKDDFEGNIIIENANESSEIISSNISYRYPKNINVNLAQEHKNKIEIIPGLLNSGDSFSIDILSNKELKISINSRIADTKFIVIEDKNQYSFMMIVGVLESHFYLLTFIIAILFYFGFAAPYFGNFMITLLLASTIILFMNIISEWRMYRSIIDDAKK